MHNNVKKYKAIKITATIFSFGLISVHCLKLTLKLVYYVLESALFSVVSICMNPIYILYRAYYFEVLHNKLVKCYLPLAVTLFEKSSVQELHDTSHSQCSMWSLTA